MAGYAGFLESVEGGGNSMRRSLGFLRSAGELLDGVDDSSAADVPLSRSDKVGRLLTAGIGETLDKTEGWVRRFAVEGVSSTIVGNSGLSNALSLPFKDGFTGSAVVDTELACEDV